MEAPRGVKLTDTNSLNDLKLCVFEILHSEHFLIRGEMRRPGGYSNEEPPDPIPNSDVKLVRADGTLS